MLGRMNREVISFLFKGDLPNAENTNVREASERKEKVTASRPELAQRQAPTQQNGGQQQALPTKPQSKPEPVTVGEKIGRNDPCPCGSGKKYKTCHGKK